MTAVFKKKKRAIVLLDHVNSCQLFVYLFFTIYLVFSQQQQLILKLQEQNLEIKNNLFLLNKQKTKQQKLNRKKLTNHPKIRPLNLLVRVMYLKKE